MAARIFLGLVALLVALVLVHRGLSWPVPGYGVLAPSLLLLVAASYFPVLAASVRDGAISVPPQTVRRHQKPALFWTVVVVHAALAAATAIGALAGLLGRLG